VGDKKLADFVSRHHNFFEIKSSDCIATVTEHDQIHMFRDFVSKCGLGLTWLDCIILTPRWPPVEESSAIALFPWSYEGVCVTEMTL